MLVSNCNVSRDSSVTSVRHSSTESTIALLDELLTRTIAVRDLYKNARCRTAISSFAHIVRHYLQGTAAPR